MGCSIAADRFCRPCMDAASSTHLMFEADRATRLDQVDLERKDL